jgi:hypothetical protein
LFLLWKQNNRAVVTLAARGGIAASMDGVDDVTPDVWCVVSVQVDDLLGVWRKVLVVLKLDFGLAKINRHCGRWRRRTMAGDLVQIVLIGFCSNDVNHFVERHLGVVL